METNQRNLGHFQRQRRVNNRHRNDMWNIATAMKCQQQPFWQCPWNFLNPLDMMKHFLTIFICESVPLHRCISNSPKYTTHRLELLPLVVSAVTAAFPAERRSFFYQDISQSQSSPLVMVAPKLSYHYAVPCVPTQSGSGTKMDLRIKP